LSLPKMEKASDAANASAAIVEAASAGELTPSEAGELLKIVESPLVVGARGAFFSRHEPHETKR
jgi:hypothetical protein